MANSKLLELTVPEAAEGERLDAFLGSQAEIGSRSAAGKLIASGAVTRGQSPAKKSDEVRAGDRISVVIDVQLSDVSEPAAPFTVVFEDSHLIVVDKSAGLVVHPAPGNRTGTLSQALAGRAAGGDPERPGIVHRLDKDTSGLLVVARSDEVLRKLQAALSEREVSREYLALVVGRPESASGTIDAPLGRDRRSPEQVTIRGDAGRPALTHFEIAEELPKHTLLRVWLETGRTHQIRVHLAAIGLRVSGDLQYGQPGDLGLQRQFLHACALGFRHPITGEPMSFASPLPKDLAQALELARER